MIPPLVGPQDVPMAQGVVDFACAGQMAISTPFALMGAIYRGSHSRRRVCT